MGTEYFEKNEALYVEKGIVQATTHYLNKVKVYIPVMMPNNAATTKSKTTKSSQTNIVNQSTKTKGKVIDNSTSTIDIIVPEFVATCIRKNSMIMKGQVLYIAFLGGDINSPIVIGAE